MENLKIEISSQNSRKFESNFQVLCFWNAEKNCFCCYFTPTEWGYGSSVCSHMPWDAGNVFFDWFWTNLILGVILQKVDIFWYLSNFVNLMSPNGAKLLQMSYKKLYFDVFFHLPPTK